MRPKLKLGGGYNLKLTRSGTRLTKSGGYYSRTIAKSSKSSSKSDDTSYYDDVYSGVGDGSFEEKKPSSIRSLYESTLDIIAGSLALVLKGLIYFFKYFIGFILTCIIAGVAWFFIKLFLWLLGFNVY